MQSYSSLIVVCIFIFLSFGACASLDTAVCSKYIDLNKHAVENSTAYWRANRISQELLQLTVKRFACERERGIHVGFFGGRAYVLSRFTNIPGYFHHPQLLAAYLQQLLYLEQGAGSSIPDVEFVISTFDAPHQPPVGIHVPHWAVNSSSHPGKQHSAYPVFRFCKTAGHPDLLVPMFHFHMFRYQTAYLNKVPQWTQAFPYEQRKPVAFGRYHAYDRHTFTLAPATIKQGATSPPLTCSGVHQTAFGGLQLCHVRQHFVEWADEYSVKHPGVLDIGNTTKYVAAAEWPSYRYLVHVDGQTASSRLFQLLAMGSLILRESSGYYEYYEAGIQPYKHYVPFWGQGKGPENILEAVQWANSNPEQARQIASDAQAFAVKYLSTEARTCYWVELLQAYAQALDYKPVLAGRKYAVPVKAFLETDMFNTSTSSASRQKDFRDMQNMLRHWEP